MNTINIMEAQVKSLCYFIMSEAISKEIIFLPLASSNSSIIKFVERCKIDIPNTQKHDLSLSWFGTYSSMTCGDKAREFVLPLAYVIVFLSCQNISVLDY
jgi:hypothetical protein